MKKFIGVLLALSVVGAVAMPERKADAQVVYSRKCCDNSATVRCILDDWTPVGNPCFCYGQGWGYTC
jgi:hypothetical protein